MEKSFHDLVLFVAETLAFDILQLDHVLLIIWVLYR